MSSVSRQRRRTTRACDCKIGRKRCEERQDEAFIEGPSPCDSCKKANLNCTYTIPALRRGPAPGKELSKTAHHGVPTSIRGQAAPHSSTGMSGIWQPGDSEGLPTRAPPTFPDLSPDVLDELLVIYFTHVHNLWPIIYKPYFTLATTPLPLLQSMLCVAACVVPSQQRVRYDSETLYRAAEQAVQDCWIQPQIETVQSILLLSLRQTGCGDKQSAFGFAAQACTLALSLGLNNAVALHENIEQAHIQTRSRVWWSCYLMDKCLAEETGRPCLLRYKGCTTPLPAADEMDELESWPPLPVTSSAVLPRSVNNVKPRRGYIISAFIWTCRLAMIVENILELEWQGPPATEPFDVRFRLEILSVQSGRLAEIVASQLGDFRSLLPGHLNFDLTGSSGPPLPQVAIMIAWHATAEILFYARYIRSRCEPVSPGSISSDSALRNRAYDICAKASQTVIDTIQQLDKYQLLREACADFLYIISLTTLFQTFECTNPDPSVAERSKGNLTRCCRWLREFSSSWPAASAQKLFFEGLIQGGMRLSSPDRNVVDDSSTAGGGAAMDTSPVRHTSTSFPSVHRALYVAQGDRLNQPADVDISSMLQLPQYYWNNWDQWISNGVEPSVSQNEPDSYPLDDASLTTDFTWAMPVVAPESTIVGCSGDQYNVTPPGSEPSSQAAVTTALLRYMLEGAQAKS